MGCGSSSEGGAPPPGIATGSANQSNKVERELELARQAEEGKVKLLLLGAGESGKSTIFKQMRILYGSPRDDDDLRMFGVVVRSNVITAIRRLCTHLRNLGLEEALEEESKEVEAGGKNDPCGLSPRGAYDEVIANLIDDNATETETVPIEGDWVGNSARAGLSANNDAKQFLNHVDAIRVLWHTQTMKDVWAKRASINVIDSHKEYLNDLPRLSSREYKPTTQDILLARVRTTQVVMEAYHIDGIEFEMYDVGGQRSQRRKWIDCFDQVNAVIFVAALSEYDQSLVEAKRTNRMVEALKLFRTICSNRAFAETSIMLFLNKRDLFQEKIMSSDISDQRPFEDYSGPTKDFDAGVQYFDQLFRDCFTGGDGEMKDNFVHITCATDTENMKFVLDATRHIIMNEQVMGSGFLGED